MDKKQEKLINLARFCLAQHNYNIVRDVTREIDIDLLGGTVFDRNIDLNYAEIDRIISELKKIKKIRNISDINYTALINNDIIDLSKGEIEATFETMERNLNLFNNKFRNKVFKINTNDGSSSLISISECNFFHLLGLELNRWQEQSSCILSMFPEFKNVLEMEYRDICINNDPILLDTLHVLLEKRNRVIEKLFARDPNVSEAFNMNKIKIKNFLFERADFTVSPSAVIHHKASRGNIKGDLFLLRDHINKDSLEWGVYSFRAYNEAPPRNLESILFNYFRGKEMTSLKKSITLSIGVTEKSIYDESLEMDDIPITTRFSSDEIEYFRRILCGVNRVVKPKELIKKRTK